MKNPRIFYAVASIIFLFAYCAFGLKAEEERYIEGADSFTTNSPFYYIVLNILAQPLGYFWAVSLIKFVSLAFLLTVAFIILDKRNRLENMLLLFIYPAFISLIFTQSKNILSLGAYFAAINFPLLVFFSLGWATTYGIQFLALAPFIFLFRERMQEQKFAAINLIALAAFVLLIVGYWGSLGFHQFQRGVHEESGLVDTVLTLAIICAFDWSLTGTVSLALCFVFYAIGGPYLAYRPLELMALNAVLNGQAGIIIKTFYDIGNAVLIWMKNPMRVRQELTSHPQTSSRKSLD